MGGCATKFKVLKEDDCSVPAAPPPEPREEAVAAAPEAKEGADGVAEKADEAIVNDDKVDDEAAKRQSLSNLLNENEKGKVGAAETETKTDDNPPSEPTINEPLPVEPKSTATTMADVAEAEKKGTPAAAKDEVAK
ncbi:hypothetical protein V6N13_052782 [Hibiscus sabdariffa]|uniref:Uncharacterized protein n=1 Tax=Hibiscus sabdariffa TaxID=183260 RepID=A0ABR2Q5C6_9ROSI